MSIRILTCNIRKSDADDGDDAWPRRRHGCLDLIASEEPAIVAFQEMREDQFLDVRERFPAWRWHALTRTAGDRHPINAIFYDPALLDPIAAGGYALSKTPHVTGSTSWNSLSPRHCTWMRWRLEDGGELRLTNCHLDHGRDEWVRLRQLSVVLTDTGSYRPQYPQVLCGDFNADRRSSVIGMTLGSGWRDAVLEGTGKPRDGATAHGFRGIPPAIPENAVGRIDWILARGGCRAVDAKILDEPMEGGRYPSDHFFVRADFACSDAGTPAGRAEDRSRTGSPEMVG